MKPGRPEKQGIDFYRDAGIIVVLLMCGVEVKETVREGETVWFGFDTNESKPYVENLLHNKPIPLPDARVYIIAANTFKNIIYEN